MENFLPIASSSERPSLERLEKYLLHHGIECRIVQLGNFTVKFSLQVAPDRLEAAQRVLDGIALSHSDPGKADEVLEIRLDGNERIEVASWLQILLDEKDQEGTPIFFFRGEYEAVLDQLHESGQVEIPLYMLKGLRSFIPPMEKRVVMGHALQEFFSLIEAVAEGEE